MFPVSLRRTQPLSVVKIARATTTPTSRQPQDNLEGGAGDDTINGGGDGTDTIIGGDGTDQLYGDGGQDTFLVLPSTMFGAGSTGTRIQDEYDTINDLTIGSGADADLIQVAGHTAIKCVSWPATGTKDSALQLHHRTR